MISPPFVTTVIPTYRRPQLLQQAIESALRQAGPSLIVRVFDNASGDETSSVVAAIAAKDQRLRYHCHERNIGATANFEFGLRSIDTPFFSILSDDDYLLPDFYKYALNDLDANPEAMFWAGMTLNVDEFGKIWHARVDDWVREGLFSPPEGMMTMMHGRSPAWTGIVFRREILDTIGLPDPEVLGPADFDFILRAAARYKYIVRKHPSAVLVQHDRSFSMTQPLSSFWPGWQMIFHNIGLSSVLSQQSKALVLRALHQDAKRMLFRRGANALSMGRYDYSYAAAEAFETQYGKALRPLLLKSLADACRNIPLVQSAYALTYRSLERLLVKSRSNLELRFGHLIKRS